MELKLIPVMTRLHPERDIAQAIRFTPMFDGKFSPVVRLFFRIGLWAYEAGIVPHDPLALQALLGEGSVEERSERLPNESPTVLDPLQCLLCVADHVAGLRPEQQLERCQQ